MVILAILIIWLGVPMLAQNEFGEPAGYLTRQQRWNYGLQILINKRNLTTPNCVSSQKGDFIIESGSSINQIVSSFEGQGLIADAASLRAYLIYKGLDTQILAGNYQLGCGQTAVQIADSIKNIYQDEVIFNILPGWRAEEIAAALPSSGIEVSPDDFLRVVYQPDGLNLPGYLPAGNSLEGFLFPGEYTISRTITAEGLVQLFIDKFMLEVPVSLLEQAQMNGITQYQAIIMASIVQRETFAAEERPIMASVFYNRLAQGMRLETDPTVQYALGYDPLWGWWKSPLAQSDLLIQSPYNTYLVNGLPPGPIANPELSSIEAVLSPAQTDFLYFRAKCDNSGMHIFASTFEEHLANSCE
jgi:UPF0755 protein